MQIVGDERHVLVAVFFDFQRKLRGVGLHSQADGFVDDSIDDAQVVAVDHDAMLFGNVVDATSQDVVFGDDFFDVEAIVEALATVGGRAALEQRVFERIIGLRFERIGQFVDEDGHVVVERWRIQPLSRWQLADLPSPAGEQDVTLLANERTDST